MLVGIISDTHDDMDQIKKVVDLFNEREISHVLHAGDLISPFTFEIMDFLSCQFTGIFGNNDGDKLLLKEKSGGSIHNQPLNLFLDGKRVVLIHEPVSVEAFARSGSFDIVIYGHTHTPESRKVGDTMVVNPGKVARLHKGKSTAAILDTRQMSIEFIEL